MEKRPRETIWNWHIEECVRSRADLVEECVPGPLQWRAWASATRASARSAKELGITRQH